MQGAHPELIGLTIIDTNLTGTDDWSDQLKQPIRPVECAVQQQAKLVVPILAPHDEEAPSVSQVQDDEKLVGYEASPEHDNMAINMVNLHLDHLCEPMFLHNSTSNRCD